MKKFNFGLTRKIKEQAQRMVLLGYKAPGFGAETTVKKIYNKINQHCARALYGGIKNNDYKYWKNTILGKYFGRCIKGSPCPFVLKTRKWLEEFWKRVRDKKVTEEDRQIIREVFLPYMERTKEVAPIEYMKKMKMWK